MRALGSIQVGRRHYALAVELARAQRFIKGYGETHERGWRNFCALLEQLEYLSGRSDGAQLLSRLLGGGRAPQQEVPA